MRCFNMSYRLAHGRPHGGTPRGIKFFRAAVLLVGLTVSGWGWTLSTLQIGEVTVENSLVIIPVMLGGDAGGSVASLNFHLNYDPDILEPVQVAPGSVAAQADKQVAFNVPSPGESVIVMFGLNQTTCSGGEVARIVMKRSSEAASSQWALGLSDQTLSDVQGAVIDSRVLPYTPPPDDVKDGKNSKPDDKPKPESPERPETDRPERPTGWLPKTHQDGTVPAGVGAQRVAVAEAVKAPGTDAKREIEDALKEAAQARSAIATPTADSGEAAETLGTPQESQTGERIDRSTMTVAQVGQAESVSESAGNTKFENGNNESPALPGTAGSAVPARRSGRTPFVAGGAVAVLAAGILAFVLLHRR